jgi:hypothetical protein
MDNEECYRWGEIFAEPWNVLAEKMADRASTLGLHSTQSAGVLADSRRR